MPGSTAVMQILLPQLDVMRVGLDETVDFTHILMGQLTRLSEVVRRCLPGALWHALKEAGKSTEANKEVCLLGEDVITEIAARACASTQDGPVRAIFEPVRAHLQILTKVLTCRVALPQSDDDTNGAEAVQHEQLVADPDVSRALLPAIASVLLLPIAQQVAALQMQFPTGRPWTADQLEPFLDGARTWKEIKERSIQAALELHASDLEDSLCDLKAGKMLQDPQLLAEKIPVGLVGLVLESLQSDVYS